jgi:putative SOS response-associated peptidase YedK
VCSRFTNTLGPEELGRQIGERLGVRIHESAGTSAYNIAPTEQVLAIVAPDGAPQARDLRWGLVPAWAEQAKASRPYINAKIEGVRKTGKFLGVPADTPHRALIVATEFAEWVKSEQSKDKPAPFGFSVDSGRAFCFAGIWTVNSRVEDEPLASCTILTCDAASNPLVSAIHSRMPVILPDPEHWRAWIDPRISQQEALSLCGPLPAERMSARPLSPAFNNVRNKSPHLLTPADQPA